MKQLFLIFSLLCTINLYTSAQCDNPGDYQVLYTLYNSTDGDNWTDNSNWDVSAVPPNVPANLDMSSWYGITCEGGRVTRVSLGSNNLVGSIPPILGKLAMLERLWLNHNQLTGSIPAQLGNLANLFYLTLHGNQLTGSIPAQLGNLDNLKYLYLQYNQLTGSIPAQLGNLDNLEVLYLQYNQLTGSIPAQLGNLDNLEVLYLHNNNQLTGSIPNQLGNLANLKQLTLYGNQLTGSIPTSFNQLQELVHLKLDNNQLSGCYDAALKDGASVLCNFPNEYISQGNNFDAPWDDFCNNDAGVCGGACNNADDYAALYALYNSTDGDNWNDNSNWDVSAVPPNVPANLDMSSWYGITCDGGRVTAINLNFNQLAGSIPVALENLSHLQHLILYNNQLTGSIPAELGNLSNLKGLQLFSNQLTGSIPTQLGNLGDLETLWLFSNQLTGSIPNQLGNLGNIQTLAIYGNQLTGSIPVSFNQLTQLATLRLDNNQLSGCYDAALKDGASVLCNFSNGHISDGNNFDAPWDDFCNNDAGVCGGACNNADDYAALYALYNSTDGDNWDHNSNWDVSAVPPNVPANLDMSTWYGITCDGSRVTKVDLGANLLVGSIPTQLGNLDNLERLSLSNNQLTGSIPAQLGNLDNLEVLSLFNNQLTGSIPAQLGNLDNLEVLSLAYNQLTGSIPAQLGNLANLKELHLYNNQLTGSIPAQLGNLANLKFLSLSNNQLTGSIPAQLGNLANLERLYLNHNQLTGSIPTSFNQLQELILLRLYDNQLSGCYDAALKDGASVLCNFSNGHISDGNNFDAPWDDFCNNDAGVCSNDCNNADDYAALYALYNSTDGDNWDDNSNWDLSAVPPNVPANLDMSSWYGITCDGSRVTEVDLGANLLVGSIPAQLGNLDNLERLSLYNNQLTGSIPAQLGNLVNLKYLYLYNNQLTGNIPAQLGNLANLKFLSLDNNQLTGSIPAQLGNLANLEFLSLNINQLTGSIPAQLGNLANLEVLSLNINQLTGSIPAQLGNLANLKVLSLSVNQLTGSIPAQLGNLANLEVLSLNINQLTGSIPTSFNQLQELILLKLDNNQLSGCYDAALKDGASVLCDFSNVAISDGNNFDAPWEDFCDNYAGVCCGFNQSNWVDGELAEYSIIASKKLSMTNSTVVEGGVAVMDASEVNIEDHTDIQTFLLSEEASIDGTSTVAEYIDDEPALQLPPFMSNTFHDANNVTVMNGQMVTLSGSHYGYITVMSGGTLNFDNPTVFVQNIATKSQAKINFLQPSHVMVRKRVSIGMLNNINENEEAVVIYVGNSFKVAQGSEVNVDVYAREKIKVNDSGSSMTTYMYGIFISKKGVSSQDNVVWAWSPTCVEMENQNLQQLPDLGEEELFVESKNITLYPNPTNGNFSITAQTFMQQKVDIKIYNTLGQTVWQLHFDTLEDAIIPVDLSGSQFENGVYQVSIMTGDTMQTKSFVLNKN